MPSDNITCPPSDQIWVKPRPKWQIENLIETSYIGTQSSDCSLKKWVSPQILRQVEIQGFHWKLGGNFSTLELSSEVQRCTCEENCLIKSFRQAVGSTGDCLWSFQGGGTVGKISWISKLQTSALLDLSLLTSKNRRKLENLREIHVWSILKTIFRLK